jgi:arylsulfatase
MNNPRDQGAYRGDLNNSCVTIAQVLKSAGYSTYMSGKWHVTPYNPGLAHNNSKNNWPLQRGFDEFFGTIHGAGSFYDPYSLARNNELIVAGKGFYYTDAISDTAVTFIENHGNEKPFFMYIAYTAAHWPLHAKPDDIQKYEGKYDEGWDELRKRRFEKARELKVIGEESRLSLRDESVPAWEDAPHKEWESSKMEVYAAMVDCMDQGIGRIISALKENEEFDNTIIFYLQDNGGCAEERGTKGEKRPVYADAKGINPMKPGELQDKTAPKYTRFSGEPVMHGIGVFPGPPNTYIGYGEPWANASNTPFRIYKHWMQEGGISSPLIVSWPDGIKNRNRICNSVTHIMDIMATCVDVTSANYPEEFNGHKITSLGGISLKPALIDKKLMRETPLFFEHEGNRAVRWGKWKLVSKATEHPRERFNVNKLALEDYELFDMAIDRSETYDLAMEEPGLVQQMAEMWLDWATEVKAIPYPPWKEGR